MPPTSSRSSFRTQFTLLRNWHLSAKPMVTKMSSSLSPHPHPSVEEIGFIQTGVKPSHRVRMANGQRGPYPNPHFKMYSLIISYMHLDHICSLRSSMPLPISLDCLTTSHPSHSWYWEIIVFLFQSGWRCLCPNPYTSSVLLYWFFSAVFILFLYAIFLLLLMLISFDVLLLFLKMGAELIDLKNKTAKDFITFPFSEPAGPKWLK